MLNKSVLTGTATNVSLSMPISKVDVENRLVSGFATLDNADTQGDVVSPSASLDAFQRFRGNIREMHSPEKAAGRMVKFEERVYFDEEANRFYNGIYVTAYISKGAQDTWEKVMDGTLSGFSIGGGVDDFTMDIDEDGNPIRTIVKYSLTELSLVDNPANQLANVLSIQKSTGTVTGILADVETKTIFFCPTDGVALVSREEKHDCSECGNHMENIGWCESSGENVMKEMQKAMTNYLAADDRKGGAINNMTVEKNDEVASEEVSTEKVDEVEATDADEITGEVDETPAEEADAPEEEGEAVDAEEDEGAEDLTAVLAEFQERLMKSIEDGHTQQTEQVESLRKEFGGIEDKFTEKLDALEKSIAKLESDQEELGKNFNGIRESVAQVEKGLKDVDPSTAIKKSADTDQSVDSDTERESRLPFGGAFLNAGSL